MQSRAKRPYPPVMVSFDGSFAPDTVENIDPIAVVWKKRDRRMTVISLPSGPDEPVESGTEYCVRHGPQGFKTTTVLGDENDTTGSFNLDFKGYAEIEFFARRDGLESQALTFATVAENGAGASVAGGLATVNVVMDLVASVTVQVSVPMPPTIVLTYSDPVDIEIEDMPTITMTPLEGGVDIAIEPDSFPIISMQMLIEADVQIGTPAETEGDIGTLALTAPEGAVAAQTSGGLGTITMSAIAATLEAGVDKSVALPAAIELEEILGEAEGAEAASNSTLFVVSSAGGWGLSSASSTYYQVVNGMSYNSVGGQSNRQCQVKRAGTLRHMRAYVQANPRTTNTVFTLQKNGSDSTLMTFTVPGGGTGWYQTDNTDYETVAIDDLINYKFVTSTGTQNLVVSVMVMEFEADDGEVITMVRYTGEPALTINNSTSTATKRYNFINGRSRSGIDGWKSSRSYWQTQNDVGATGEYSDLSVRLASNTSNGTTTFTLMKNGTATGMSVSFAPGESGRKSYTGSAISVAPGDYLEYERDDTGRTSGGYVLDCVEMTFTSSDGTWDIFGNLIDAGDPGLDTPGGTCYTVPPRIYPTNTEALHQLQFPFPVHITRFRVTGSSAGSGLGAWDVYFRINGNNSNISINIPSGSGQGTLRRNTTDEEDLGTDDLVSLMYTPVGSVSGLYMASWTCETTGTSPRT